jgi:hypothetical protein
MPKLGVFLVAFATLTAQIPPAAASWEREPFPIAEEDSQSLAPATYQGYRPAWANPFAEPEISIYDDPAPFFPSGDTGSSSDDTSGDSAFDLDGF